MTGVMCRIVIAMCLLIPGRVVADPDVVYASHDLLSYAERCLENDDQWTMLRGEPGAVNLKKFLSDNNRNSRTTGVSILHIVDGAAQYKRINEYGTRGQLVNWSAPEGTDVAALLRKFENWATQVDSDRTKFQARALTAQDAAKTLKVAFRDPHVPIDTGIELFAMWQGSYGDAAGKTALARVDPALGSAAIRFTRTTLLDLQAGLKDARSDPDFEKAWSAKADAAQLLFKDQSRPDLKPPTPIPTPRPTPQPRIR